MGIVERVLRARPQVSTPAAAGVQAAPFQFYVDGDDAFRLRTWSSQVCTVALEGRWLTGDGTIQVFRYTFKTDATAQAQEFAMPVQGTYLLNCVLDVLTPITATGQCFAQLLLGRGDGAAFVKLGTVLQGYIGTGKFLGFPGSPLEDSLQGPGAFTMVNPAAPGAGLPFVIIVPQSRRWHLQRLYGLFTTDATAVQRSVSLIFRASSIVVVARFPQTVTQGPSVTRAYTWAPGVADAADTIAGVISTPIPSPSLLYQLTQVEPLISGLGGGDAWSGLRLACTEWLEVDTTPAFTL